MRGGIQLLVHGGAGGRAGEQAGEPTAVQRAGAAALCRALLAGHARLLAGASALDAVVAAVEAMEDEPALNAGLGSALTGDGRVQMDACVMEGPRGRAGAVAGVEDFAHPVQVARLVREQSPHVLLVGPDARAFALAHGAAGVPGGRLVTELRRRQLEAARARGVAELDHDEPLPRAEGGSTVGAVALDRHGALAAATSTGGLTNQLPGRVGDSPIPGAGTWADERVAVSATGEGERFLEAAFAHEVAAQLRLAGASLEEACLAALRAVEARGGRGGCIALTATGEVALPFNTARMLRGAIGPEGRPEVWL